MKDTTSKAFFEDIYSQNSDPWQFASSEYETARYDAMLRMLQPGRYRRAFEPGCSIGVLTARLAPMCDQLEAIDVSPIAVQQAQARCADLPHVHIQPGALPADLPPGEFDLVVFSEIGYYFQAEDLTALLDCLVAQMSPLGTLLATHWLGHSPDHLLSGDQVHELVASSSSLTCIASEHRDKFRIDLFRKEPLHRS